MGGTRESEKLEEYDMKLGKEFLNVRGLLRFNAWVMDYGNGGYIAYKWKKNDKQELILP